MTRLASLPRPPLPAVVLVSWGWHLIITLVFAFILQANPELPEAPWFSTPDWAGNLAHWDVNWEFRIVDQGYGPDFSPQTSAKFPLAALFARLLHQAFNLPIQVALFIVNKAGLLLALSALWHLVARLHNPPAANRAIGYIAFPIFGTAFIYWMSYPDPLFLAWWALAFTSLFQRRYFRAGLWTVLAVWSRPQGALLLPVFALSILLHHRAELRAGLTAASRVLRPLLAACLLPTLALIAWVIRVSDVTAIPFSPYLAQSDVRQTGLMWPWDRLALRLNFMLTEPPPLNPGYWLEAWQLLLIIVGLIALIALAYRRRLPWELCLFSGLSVAFPLLTGIIAIGRFATLTWLPLVFIYCIPPRLHWLDSLLWALGLILSLAVLIGLNLANTGLYYVP